MAGEVEECITHQSNSLSSGSISFGRFDLESLSWERRSSFSHNRYLEEVEKYSTPGSVTKKKEYFEAHFKKKALLHQVSVENQKETETKHAEYITVNDDAIIEDFICHVSNKMVEVSCDDRDAPASAVEHEAVELQKEEISSAELNTGFPSSSSEKYTELFNEPLVYDSALQSQVGDNGVQLAGGSLCGLLEDKAVDANVNSKKLVENGDALLKIRESEKKNESIHMRSQKVSTKTSDTVEQKAGKSQFRTHLSPQQMSKKPSRNGSSVFYGKLKKVDKQIAPAKLEKRLLSKVSSPKSTENGNFKIMAFRNTKAKASSETKSEEGVRAKKAEAMPRRVERRGSDVRQPVHSCRVKLISNAEDKQTSAVFKFKSSERAEKRKEYFLKLEEKLHAKAAEMNEIQARTEEVKEAEMKQFRKSLNFKATPMPSFYHETATKVAEGRKKISAIPAISPITRDKSSTSSAIDKLDGAPTTNYSAAKKIDRSNGEEKGKFNSSKDMRKKGDRKSRVRSGIMGKVKGIDDGNVAVHVAS